MKRKGAAPTSGAAPFRFLSPGCSGELAALGAQDVEVLHARDRRAADRDGLLRDHLIERRLNLGLREAVLRLSELYSPVTIDFP